MKPEYGILVVELLCVFGGRWKMGLQEHINAAINHFLLELVRRRGITLAHEEITYTGTIKWRELPFDPIGL